MGDATPVEDISFTYGPAVTGGDGGALTVGAENVFGNRGGTVYYNGTGSAPAPSSTGYEVRVSADPPAPGGSHTLSFTATGKSAGAWTNCAEMTSDVFAGTAMACASGRVNGK